MPRFPSLLMAAGLLVAGPLAAQRPDLNGEWRLKDAPTPPDSLRDTDSVPLPPPPPDLRPVVRRRGKPEEQQQLARLVGMAQPIASFQIRQTDSSVTFENTDGFTYTVHTDGGPDSVLVGEDWIWMRGRWKGRVLEVEVRPPGGGRIIESYELADSGIYLRLEVVIEHDLLAQRLWRPRMYRLQEPDQAGP